MYKVNDQEYECSIIATLDVLNDKWKLAIIWNLLNEEKRLKDLTQDISGITKKTLTVKLKELEEKNIVHREVFAQVPPKVVYSLTPIAQELKPLFKNMYQWGIKYIEKHGEVINDDVCHEEYLAKKFGFK